MTRKFISEKTVRFNESVIREMSRIAHKFGALNLAQGFPDFPASEILKEEAVSAIRRDINQYAVTWGAPNFRRAIAQKWTRLTDMEIDPDREITVCCGSTEAMIASMLALVDPGEEVIVFEPFYENYGPDTILAGATPRFVSLHPPDWSFDPRELQSAFRPNTKAIIINTPNNPTGKVFNRKELEFIADLCREHQVLAITDEIYEHIVFDGEEHIRIAGLPGMRSLTVTISGLSKSYSVTGWRVGYAIASPELTLAIRKVHDFLTVGAAAPMQEAGVAAMNLPPEYYRDLAAGYQERRDFLLDMLQQAGFRCCLPKGAYYLMADIGSFRFPTDTDFNLFLAEKIGIIAVPGSSFFRKPEDGHHLLRFCFCKQRATLEEARQRLSRLPEALAAR